jgi:hypothetical protein
MAAVNIVGLFCEDIREEKSGASTLVGILTDNLVVPSIPFLLPRLALYVRVNFAVATDPGPIVIRVVLPDQSDPLIAPISPALIDTARAEARDNCSPIAGLITTAVASPFTIKQAGRVLAIANVQGQDVICGSLNIREAGKPEL